jgi:hypothetical protein
VCEGVDGADGGRDEATVVVVHACWYSMPTTSPGKRGSAPTRPPLNTFDGQAVRHKVRRVDRFDIVTVKVPVVADVGFPTSAVASGLCPVPGAGTCTPRAEQREDLRIDEE